MRTVLYYDVYVALYLFKPSVSFWHYNNLRSHIFIYWKKTWQPRQNARMEAHIGIGPIEDLNCYTYDPFVNTQVHVNINESP